MPRQSMVAFFSILTGLVLVSPCPGGEAVSLQESFAPGSLYHVSARVELEGSLTLHAEKDEKAAPKSLLVSGKSSLDYDERILLLDKQGKVNRTVRVYQQLGFERKVGDHLQKAALRPEVKRLVILRHQQMEVPFSPDGPLTWGEIDLVRTDVFTPALQGLLPAGKVQPGDRWSASTSAIVELTDFAELDQGGLACKFEQIAELGGQKHARIGFQGTVVGTSEDGNSKQQLDGYLYFNLAGNYLSYLSMKGTQSLLNEEGKTVGKLEGTFVLTRKPLSQAAGLNNADLAKLTLEPTKQNTLLLYEDSVLGIRLQYPRRWHVAGGKGPQLGLDEKGGSGILLTVEPLKQVPTGAQFFQESQQWWKKQQASIQVVGPVKVMRQSPTHIEHFTLDVNTAKEKFRMYYLVVRHSQGGVVAAARLQFHDLAELQTDVQQIVASIQFTKKQ